MITGYIYDSKSNTLNEATIDQIAAKAGPGSICWLDIESPLEEDYLSLADLFKVEPLAMKEIRNAAGVPRIITGENLSYICWYGPEDGIAGPNARINILFTDNLLITIRDGRVPAIDNNLEEIKAQPEIIGRGTGVLLYNILDTAVDQHFLIVDQMSDRIDDIEDVMFANPDADDVKNLFELKRQMIDLRRVVAPEREVVNSLLRRELISSQSNTEAYFQDLYDHLVRIIDLIDTLRDVTSGAMQIYQATISNNLNDIMKQLTIIATIMMPLTLISGIFGMNLGFPGRETAVGFWIVMTAIVGIGVAMVIWIRKRGWS